MRWELSEEQDLFRQTLRDWLTRTAPAADVRRWLDDHDPATFERALVDEGWLGVGIAEDLGGQGGGLIELALAAEEFGRACVPSSAWLATVLAAPALAGIQGLADTVLGDGTFAALAGTADRAPDSDRYDFVRRDDSVDGSASDVLGADRVGHLLAAVPDDGDTPGLFLVEAAAAGVTIVPRALLDRSRTVAEVGLDAVQGVVVDVDAPALLAEAASRAAVLVAADSLGVLEKMLELSVGYSKQREAFGVPIGSFQAIKHAAATMLVDAESARSIVYYAAASVDAQAADAALVAAAAKAQVTAQTARAADLALTMHGAIGYTWEYELQLLYKRAKLNQSLFGSPAVWNERLAGLLPLVAG